MADFKTHIAVSTMAGAAYGTIGTLALGMPVESSIIAGGLCSVSGMLPDLDSDNSVPVREMLSFGAAATPMLLIDRFHELQMTSEQIVIVSAAFYVMIRFVFGEVLKHFTVHRGMFHSIPALLIASGLVFVVSKTGGDEVRFFKAGGVALGFFSHLLLDEIWAVKWTKLGPRTKKSFGTAIKFFGESGVANSITYALLLGVGMLALQDMGSSQQPMMAQSTGPSIVERIAAMFESSQR